MASGLELCPPSPAPSLADQNPEERIAAMVGWFNANFEDPVHETPYNGQEGGYQYIWGGPYDARDELQTYFDDAADEDIGGAVAEIEGDGLTDWAPNGNRIQPDGPDDDVEDRPEPLAQRLESLRGKLDGNRSRAAQPSPTSFDART